MKRDAEGGLEDYIISRYAQVPISQIHPDPKNIREGYSKGSLIILANSLATCGQIQPVLAEKTGRNHYDLIAGHRRYWSSRLAIESGWMTRDWMIAKVVGKLPDSLRLRLQNAENEYKEPVPAGNLANVLWERYKPALIQTISGISDGERDVIHAARTFEEIPADLRRALPLTEYARLMGLGKKTVLGAMQYQTLHGNIREMVERGNLSYSAACAVSAIEDRTQQRRTIASIQGEPTRAKVREAVRQYQASVEREKESGSFLTVQTTSGRTKFLKDLSHCLGESDRLLRVLQNVEGIVPGTLDLVCPINGHETSPRKILVSSHENISLAHNSFMADETYKRRWDFSPRATSIEQFVLEHARSGGSRDAKVMDVVESKMIQIGKIDPNPLNPRGRRQSFNEEKLEGLARSIGRDGLINDLLVMRNGDRYTNLEGHRRWEALQRAKGKTGLVGCLVLPNLTEDQQVMVMCDADIFERVSLDTRAKTVTRQFELDKKTKKNLSVAEFSKNHPEWSPQIIRDALDYERLPGEVKRLYCDGLITHRVALDISKIEGEESQIDYGITAAIIRQSHADIKQQLEEKESGQMSLIASEDLQDQKKKGELRLLVTQMDSYFSGAGERAKQVAGNPELVRSFLKDDYLIHRFQGLFRAMEESRTG